MIFRPARQASAPASGPQDNLDSTRGTGTRTEKPDSDTKVSRKYCAGDLKIGGRYGLRIGHGLGEGEFGSTGPHEWPAIAFDKVGQYAFAGLGGPSSNWPPEEKCRPISAWTPCRTRPAAAGKLSNAASSIWNSARLRWGASWIRGTSSAQSHRRRPIPSGPAATWAWYPQASFFGPPPSLRRRPVECAIARRARPSPVA